MKGVGIFLGDYPPKEEPYTAMVATDRQAVLDLMDECRGRQIILGRIQSYAFEITMPCGYSKKFEEHSDIPLGELPCPCGQKGHYLIRYTKGVRN